MKFTSSSSDKYCNLPQLSSTFWQLDQRRWTRCCSLGPAASAWWVYCRADHRVRSSQDQAYTATEGNILKSTTVASGIKMYTVEPRLAVTSLVRKPPHYSHRGVPNCISQCKTPCNKVTSPLRSLLPSPVGDLNSQVPLYMYLLYKWCKHCVSAVFLEHLILFSTPGACKVFDINWFFKRCLPW